MNTLIVNLSLRSIRVIIFDDSGKKLYENWLPVRTVIEGQTVEQDPDEWWKLLIELMDKFFSKKELFRYTRYVSITSSASCLVVVDKKGNVLRKSIMVSDKRAV